ncbi:hypothetical protein HWV62_31803 [Athelia sp. TMB]|nr:hypothetical protein HWV62_31803 [Athelia sp. TMB]
MASNAQHMRLRRPDTSVKPTPKPARHTGILQDQLRRAQKRPWNASFSLAIRILLLVRVAGAMYSNIQDCDEVFNFWEPLHYLDRGIGFQTWETSPVYAIRSWAYILLHLFSVRLPAVVLGPEKRPAFFALRITLGVISTLCEAKLYRTVVERVNERVGRYLFFMLLFSAGMWNASTAFLPSSFAMYASTLAFSFSVVPPSSENNRRTLLSTLAYATGAIVGWPFALALAIPFVVEELFILGADRVASSARGPWFIKRSTRLIGTGLAAALIFIPVIGLDTLAYGRLTIVPWNIIRYNIFGGSERGPDLYGTESWHFYILNLILNFNVLVPLALISLPALFITSIFDRKRLGLSTGSEQSSPFLVLGAHKEERFMFPAYPMLCFNAAVALYLVRGWLEVTYIKMTNSPYQASRSKIFSNFTFYIVCFAGVISMSRIVALWKYYHAPQTIYFQLEDSELPRLLQATGLVPEFPPNTPVEEIPRIDLSPVKVFNLTLCVGKEWHRFPGHYLVPDGVRVDFVKSDFDGLLPGHFGEGPSASAEDGGLWWREGTRSAPVGLNDLNREAPGFYVADDQCDYLVDLDFPLHPSSSMFEPRYAADAQTWERVACVPFLDARYSSMLTRALWMPGEKWQSLNEFGDYCLLKNKRSVARKEAQAAVAFKFVPNLHHFFPEHLPAAMNQQLSESFMFAFPSIAPLEEPQAGCLSTPWGVHGASTLPSGEAPAALDCNKTSGLSNNVAREVSIPQSNSMLSVQTTGTFGPTYRYRELSTTNPRPALVHPTESYILQPKSRQSSLLDRPHGLTLSTDEDARESRIAALRFTLSEYLGSSDSYADARTVSPTAPNSPSAGFLSSTLSYRASGSSINLQNDGLCAPTTADSDEPALEDSTSCQTLSTLPSPIFGPPSPSPSGNFSSTLPSSSAFWKKLRPSSRSSSHGHNSPVKGRFTRNSPLQSPSRFSTASPIELEFPDSAPCSPDTTTAATPFYRRQRVISNSTIASIASCPLPSVAPVAVPSLAGLIHETLPQSLSWLKDIKLHLSIDQEGFRAVDAHFRLAGWSEHTRSLYPFERDNTDADTASFHAGVADFVPVMRQTFVFHHSALDTPPILRRISVNKDETREYISRHASLTLKRNGVYTVSGSEAFSPSSLAQDLDNENPDVGGNTRLKWKLEYIVLDRIFDARGGAIVGEKTLTPLSFSCSPFLLHPLQGKKVRLMRILKKNMFTNILAEKLDPPAPPSLSINIYRQAPAQKRTGNSSGPYPSHKKKGSWSFHRRVRSQAPDENNDPALLRATERAALRGHPRPARKRRASSAGDLTSLKIEQMEQTAMELREPLSQQNIIPKAQLNQMMDHFSHI